MNFNWCDGCQEDFSPGDLAYQVDTGRTEKLFEGSDPLPIVKIFCFSCFGSVPVPDPDLPCP